MPFIIDSIEFKLEISKQSRLDARLFFRRAVLPSFSVAPKAFNSVRGADQTFKRTFCWDATRSRTGFHSKLLGKCPFQGTHRGMSLEWWSTGFFTPLSQRPKYTAKKKVEDGNLYFTATNSHWCRQEARPPAVDLSYDDGTMTQRLLFKEKTIPWVRR